METLKVLVPVRRDVASDNDDVIAVAQDRADSLSSTPVTDLRLTGRKHWGDEVSREIGIKAAGDMDLLTFECTGTPK